jgi:hypothetical protein
VSDYGSISDVFKESLKEHLDPVVKKEANLETESGAEVLNVASDIIQFMDRVVQDWVRSMDDSSRQEVKDLFLQMENVSTAEFIQTMHSNGMSSPFSVMAKLFEGKQEPDPIADEEIIEIIEPDELRG